MRLLLLVLLGIIGAYTYYTDSRRVRAIAENYLSRVLNAHVQVGHARLSIFEGLRLDGVSVYVDDRRDEDSTIFTAESFRIDYSPQSILSNRLEARQIVAVSPHVRLVENHDTGLWNYQRMMDRTSAPAAPAAEPQPAARPLVLPEIILRDARIEYSEIRDGQLTPRGSMAVEGRLYPAAEPGRYAFEVQSRGPTDGVGAVLTGSIVPATGQFAMRLRNFDFGSDVLAMMPAQVRQWCIEHGLAGRVDVPELSYTPARDGKPASFRVVTELHGVMLAVHPEEWRSRRENLAQERMNRTIRTLRLGPLNARGPLARLQQVMKPQPVRFTGVSGELVFDQNGIDIRNLSGRLETNGFKVAGHIDGYTPDATAHLRLSSLDSENIYIPHAPRYISSLPGAVREIYDHLRPVGSARIAFELIRTEPGGRPKVSGQVEIVDGQFTFDRFPYPLRNVTGKIILGTDPEHGWERLELSGLRGYGIAGGPNADKLVQVSGTIGPLGPESAVHIEVRGKNIVNEPALLAALPSQASAAIATLDAEGEGRWPTFRLDFLCDVKRPLGRNTRWSVATDLFILEAAGRLKHFPYPLEKLTGVIRVRDGRLEIVDGAMRRGDAELSFAGDFTWDTPDERGSADSQSAPVRPNLRLSARNVPVDDDLLAALPPDQRQWLQRLGPTGRIDLEGAVLPPQAGDAEAAAAGDFHFEFNLDLRNATFLPIDDQPLVTDATARLRVTPQRVVVSDLVGKIVDARLTADGVATWADATPLLNFRADAQELQLNDRLYRALPPAARQAWDMVRPDGTADVQLTYSGAAPQPKDGVATPALPTTQPAATIAAAAGDNRGFELTIKPRELAVTPEVFPVRLDSVAGRVIVGPDRIRLEDLSAKRGDGRYRLTGFATRDADPVWNLHLQAEHVLLDDAVRNALPETLALLVQRLDMRGNVSVDFPKFVYRPGETPAAPEVSIVDLNAPATRPQPDSRLDFDGTVTLHQGQLDVGVLLDKVDGKIKLAGHMERGALSQLTGTLEIASMLVAGRDAKQVRGELTKAQGQPVLRIEKLRGGLAGGEVAGSILLAYPDQGPSRYVMDLALHDADVRQLTGETEREITGRLAASLALEGSWDDPASRRGRGEVVVGGKQMYQIPVILGLIEITNLALPINSPFTTATARYSVVGKAVTFEQIELRSDQMRMSGSGSLNFDTQRVAMSFTTDNPNWPKLPVIGDILQGARNEMFQIRVTGTVQAPKVRASSFNTFQTTIDEVVRASGE